MRRYANLVRFISNVEILVLEWVRYKTNMLEKNTQQIARNMQTARSFLYLRVISKLFANTLGSRFAVFGNYKKNCKNRIDSIESKMHDLLRRAMFCCVYLLISDSDHNCINKSKHEDDLKLFYEWNWSECARTTAQRTAESSI